MILPELNIAAMIVVALVWFAVLVDHKYLEIPNEVVLLVAVFGSLYWVQLPPEEVASSGIGLWLNPCLGLLIGLAGMLPGYLIGSTGAGDVKLMSASGTALGPEGVFLALILCYLIGGAMAGAVAFRAHLQGKQGPGSRYLGMVQSFVTTGRVAYVRPSEEEFMGQRFPFAFPIAAAVTLTLAYQVL